MSGEKTGHQEVPPPPDPGEGWPPEPAAPAPLREVVGQEAGVGEVVVRGNREEGWRYRGEREAGQVARCMLEQYLSWKSGLSAARWWVSAFP